MGTGAIHKDPWYLIEDSDASANAVRELFDGVRIWRRQWVAAYHYLTEAYERQLWSSVRSGFAIPENGWPDGIALTETSESLTQFQRPAHNLQKSAIDVLAARLFGETPRLRIATSGGDYHTRLVAERKSWALTSLLDTEVNRLALFEAYRDGLKTGFGAVWPTVRNGQFRLDRVTLEDLWWHPLDARDSREPNAPPRSLHVVRRLAKGQVEAMIDECEYLDDEEKEEMKAKLKLMSYEATWPTNETYTPSAYDRSLQISNVQEAVDMVAVVHSWHLPSAANMEEDECDGRELIQVRGMAGLEPDLNDRTTFVLYDGPWERMTHPIVWWSPYPAHQGMLGVGIGHVASTYQEQLDIAWPRLEQLLRDWGLPNVLYDPSAEDQKENISGDQSVNFVKVPPALGSSMRSMNKPYEIILHSPQDPQLLNWVGTTESAMFGALGINEGIAVGGSDLGANASGAALNAEDTRADVRFTDVLRQGDGFHICVGQETLHTLDDEVEDDTAFSIPFTDRFGADFNEPWRKLRMDPGAYAVMLEQVGALGRTAAARIRAIEQLGQLNPEIASAALRAVYIDHDLANVTELANEDQLFVEWQLFYLAFHADDGVEDRNKLADYWPDEVTDLTIADTMSKKHIQRARRQGASQEVIDVLMEYRAQVKALQDTQTPAPAAQPVMPGMMPEAIPGMPPEAGGMPGLPPEMPGEELQVPPMGPESMLQ